MVKELTLTQKKLLKLLSINAKYQTKHLSTVLNLSEKTVESEIERLEKERYFEFTTYFDYRKIGYRVFHFFISTKNPKKVLETNFNNIHDIISCNSCFGKYDYQIVILAKSNEKAQEIFESINLDISNFTVLETYSNLIDMTSLNPIIDVEVKLPENNKIHSYKLNDEVINTEKEGKEYVLEDNDKKLIKILLKNPRAKFSQISKESGINHETIRYRIKKMIEEKFLINFGVIHNPHKYGIFSTHLLCNFNKLTNEVKEFLLKSKD
jgi:DNA-binding Lrp family transcriptional regulator